MDDNPRLESLEYRGADAAPEARPGVPMEKDPPAPAPGTHWQNVEGQEHPPFEVLKRAQLDELTPVYGTGQPPHGLSGALRRAAYNVPEHKTSHWALLLLADRVDVVESAAADLLGNARRRNILFGAAAATGLALGAAARSLRQETVGPRMKICLNREY